VHRLQRKAREDKISKVFRARAVLRIDQLQFVARPDHELSSGLRADADPVEAIRWDDRAVGLDRDRKASRMQRLDQRRVQLQQRLAAGQYGEAVRLLTGPLP